LIDQGWTTLDIDNMDIFYYFDILAYRLKDNPSRRAGVEKDVYIDEVGWL